MIPELTLNLEEIKKVWKTKKNQDFVINLCEARALGNDIPIYTCDDNWIELNVYNEFNKLATPKYSEENHIYGYCDTEDALIKYLKKFIDDNDSWFVSVSLMSMEYEKYYKNGTYINKDGIDTNKDYYDYIDEHPDMEVNQDYDNNWIHFVIYRLLKNE